MGKGLLTCVFVVSHNFSGSDRDPTGKYAAAEMKELETTSSSKEQDGTVLTSSSKMNEETKKGGAVSIDNSVDSICWYKAQAETSCTYGGTIGMLLTGGLNLQIEHHLFPRISSWYYPIIQQGK